MTSCGWKKNTGEGLMDLSSRLSPSTLVHSQERQVRATALERERDHAGSRTTEITHGQARKMCKRKPIALNFKSNCNILSPQISTSYELVHSFVFATWVRRSRPDLQTWTEQVLDGKKASTDKIGRKRIMRQTTWRRRIERLRVPKNKNRNLQFFFCYYSVGMAHTWGYQFCSQCKGKGKHKQRWMRVLAAIPQIHRAEHGILKTSQDVSASRHHIARTLDPRRMR